jgi:hypothetical protein
MLSEIPASEPLSDKHKSFRLSKARPLTVILVLMLAWYFVVLKNHASYAVGGSDASGYANLARSLLTGRVKSEIRELDTFRLPENFAPIFTPLAYTSLGKNGTVTRMMSPFYPIGFPLHESIGALLAGWRLGPFLVSPLLGTLTCWLVFCIGLQFGLGRPLAAAGALVMAVNPSFTFLALQPMSDVTAAFWSVVLIWAALRSRENERWLFAAGAAFGVAFLVRPTNVVMLAPLAFCVRWNVRRLGLFILGGSPLAAVFLTYNQLVFGHPLQTGYNLIGLQGLFTLKGFSARFNGYLYWIAVTMSPLLLIGWLGVAFLRSVERWRRALLIVWFGVFLIFYAGYDVFDEWWYTRFLLPAYPALIIGALLTAQAVGMYVQKLGRVWRWAAATVFLAIIFVAPVLFIHQQKILLMGKHEELHSGSTSMAAGLLPTRAVVVSFEMSGAIHFYTNHSVLIYNAVAAWQWPHLKRHILESGYEFYALLLDGEVDAAQQNVPGYWNEVGRFRHAALWRIQPLDSQPPKIKYGAGFYGLEGAPDGTRWRWMSQVGDVELQNTGKDMRLRIEGAWPGSGFKHPGTARLILNGELLDTVVTSASRLEREYSIPAARQGKGEWLQLQIEVDQAVKPSDIDPRSNDGRSLSFSLSKLLWEEKESPSH